MPRGIRLNIYYCSYNRCEVLLCRGCKIARPLTAYYKIKRGKYLDSLCKGCNKERYRHLGDKVRARRRAWEEKNRDHVKARRKRYYRDHQQTLKRQSLEWRQSNYGRFKQHLQNYQRSKKGRLTVMCIAFRRRYTQFNLATKDVFNHIVSDKKLYSSYYKLWKAWKDSGYSPTCWPVIRLEKGATTVDSSKLSIISKARNVNKKVSVTHSVNNTKSSLGVKPRHISM